MSSGQGPGETAGLNVNRLAGIVWGDSNVLKLDLSDDSTTENFLKSLSCTLAMAKFKIYIMPYKTIKNQLAKRVNQGNRAALPGRGTEKSRDTRCSGSSG